MPPMCQMPVTIHEYNIASAFKGADYVTGELGNGKHPVIVCVVYKYSFLEKLQIGIGQNFEPHLYYLLNA